MTNPEFSSLRRRHHSTPFTTRPAIQDNCRRCHAALRDPVDSCWICGLQIAGIRWRRLFFHLAVIVAPAVMTLYIWSVVHS